MSRDEFRRNLEVGQEIEDVILALLGQAISGLQITPIRGGGLKPGRGPRVLSKDFKDFDLPAHDMRGDFAGHTFDVQIKGKGYSPWFRNWSCYTHGIDRPIYDQYTIGRELTGRALLLVFFELFMAKEGPGYVPHAVAQFMHNLPAAQQGPPAVDFPNGGSFWPRNAFVKIANTSIKPAQLIMDDGVPRLQMLLRREFFPPDRPVFCTRCGKSEMFRPAGRDRQTPIWLCVSCDCIKLHPEIAERKSFPAGNPEDRLYALFGNNAVLYGP